MVTWASQPQHSADVLRQQAGATLLLFSRLDGQYYALDEVGARLWELCDGERSAADIVAVLCQEYDAPAATIEADALELLEELARERLLVADG